MVIYRKIWYRLFLSISLCFASCMAVKTWRKWASGLHGCRQAAYGVPEMQTRCQRRGLSVLFSLFGSMVQTRQHSSNHLLESYVTSFLACPPRKGVPSFAVLPEGSSSSILGGSFTSPDRGSKVRRNQSRVPSCGLCPKSYTSHSFWIGATSASSLVPSSTLKAMGRWSSSAYEQFIRLNTNEILAAQKAMS